MWEPEPEVQPQHTSEPAIIFRMIGEWMVGGQGRPALLILPLYVRYTNVLK